MKLNKIFSYEKVMRRWKNSGSASQVRCRDTFLDLNLAKRLNSCKIYLGGLIAIGDGSLGKQCEIHIETHVPWTYMCGKILYMILVELNVDDAGILVYDEYVDIVFSSDGIEYIIRLCSYTDSLRSWWIYDYLFNEVLLAPERLAKLCFLVGAGVNMSDSFGEVLHDFGEGAIWETLGKFTSSFRSNKINKVIYLNRGIFGWQKYERGIVCGV